MQFAKLRLSFAFAASDRLPCILRATVLGAAMKAGIIPLCSATRAIDFPVYRPALGAEGMSFMRRGERF